MAGGYIPNGVNTNQIIHEQMKHTDQYTSERDILKYNNLDTARTLKNIGRRKLQPATPEGLFTSTALGLGLDPKEVKEYLIANKVTGKLAQNEAAMASVDMLMKYVLLLGGIAITATALSGCVEVDAPDIFEKPEDNLHLDINEKYQEIRDSTTHVKTEKGIETRENDAYNAHISREDDKIKEIIITSKKNNNKINLVNNDADPQIDKVLKNGEVVAEEEKPLSEPLANPTIEDMLSKEVRGATYNEKGELVLDGFNLGREPQTPAEYAAELVSSRNNDDVNRYISLMTDERQEKADTFYYEKSFEFSPEYPSMTIRGVYKLEKPTGEHGGYGVNGDLILEDGQKSEYEIKLLFEEDGSLGVSIFGH